jgi:methyltransferase
MPTQAMPEAIILLAFITVQRLAELWLARRNTRALLAAGGIEYGAAHYPLIVALHAAWLTCLWVLGHAQPVDRFWLALFALLQAARAWVIFSLGPRWTTRIIVVPGVPLIAHGPYRFVRHPNYVVVALENAVVPLALGLPLVALAFFVMNLGVLSVRIRAENAALAKALPAAPPGR